MITAYHIMSA